MTPAARLQAAIDILQKLSGSPVPMDATIGDYMRYRRYIGSKDRADIVERVYGMVRSHARLGWWLARQGSADTPRTRIIASMMLQSHSDAARLIQMFDGGKFSPEPMTDSEIDLARALEGKELEPHDMDPAIRFECPPAYEQTLRDLYGDNFRDEMKAMLSAAPLDLRVNLLAVTREEAMESLLKDNVQVDAAPLCPWAVRVRGKAFLSTTKAFTKGHVEIQDEGSQMIAWLCGAQPGMQILDYCAGAGGKTLALASAMKNKGRIVAMDIDAGRLEKARPRFRRAHAHDIIEVRPLSDEKNRKWLRRQKQTFDVVLADVPCTGTGTWRRNPDTRWRAYGPGLNDLIPVQAEILEKIAGTVKPGGRLVYATCSLLPQENEQQIEKFLSTHPEFTIAPVADIFPGTPIGEPFMRLSSLRHNTDGFFAAVLQRA
jgi:16S rRNA (cytosine967-C5)-methyltransferase